MTELRLRRHFLGRLHSPARHSDTRFQLLYVQFKAICFVDLNLNLNLELELEQDPALCCCVSVAVAIVAAPIVAGSGSKAI